MFKKAIPCTVSLVIISLLSSVYAQRACDTLLFRIPLIGDTKLKSIFVCHEPGRIRKTLSGPVVMKDNTFLFYSEDGYLLYNQKGAIVDSHTVFQKNKGLPHDDPRRMKLVFPVDPSTILYCQKAEKNEFPVTIYEKKLYKNRVKPLKEKYYNYYLELENGHLFNLAHNTITDDMAAVYFAMPCLVGYSSLTKGDKWWSLDRFYSFSSPLINEREGKYYSFFPGIREGTGKRNQQLVNPVQIFRRDNNWYYTGVQANVGIIEEAYSQTFFICDAAGNILYADGLLKQINRDAIIGEDEETYYTVKKVEQFVFQPSVDKRGSMYYGIINYVKKHIKVWKRSYYTYRPVPTSPDLAHLIDVEKNIEYKPVNLSCNTKLPIGKTIPNVSVINDKGKRITAQARHLTKGEYLVRISRLIYRDVDRKLVRSRGALPEGIKAIKDSLVDVSTVGCPYFIALSGPKGMIRTFNYPPGVEVVCARIITIQEPGDIVIRVDCDSFAEVLLFKGDGSFINRFIFNKQQYTKRKDIIVATRTSPLIELDFESGQKTEKFLKWEKVVSK